MMHGAQPSALCQLTGMGWGRRWEGASRGRGLTVPLWLILDSHQLMIDSHRYSGIMLIHGRNQHNIIKQLPPIK